LEFFLFYSNFIVKFLFFYFFPILHRFYSKFNLFFFPRAPVLTNDPALADFNDFIKGILHKDPNKRICNFQKVKNHNFFKNFKFDSLFNFSLNPPVRKGLEKLLSFTSCQDEEEILAKSFFPFKNYIEVRKNIFKKIIII
jgi:hypothetical protein